MLGDYARLMRSTELTLARLEALEYDALGALLGLEGAQVAARGKTVRSKAISPHLPKSSHISLPPIAPPYCPTLLPHPIAPPYCPTLLP